MNNRIIAKYIEDFKKDFNIQEKKDSIVFEQFINYCIITRIHPDAFTSDFEKIEGLKVGGGEDTGIDGLAIIVNDHFVTNISQVADLKNMHKKLEVQFVFIQAKVSPEFKAEKAATFIFGVKDFFKDNPTIKNNENIDSTRKIKEFIYDMLLDITVKPTCRMYYVTTGKWLNDHNVLGRVRSDMEALETTGLFSSVEFIPIDADGIEALYKEIKNKVTKEITFEKKTVLPKISGVREAYIGVLPIAEYLKLITGSDNKIQKNLFYDNVRDFLGSNNVNNEIAGTITDKDEQDKFAILNNGVTIVAKSINPVGDAFKLNDFQIVNGCQTSHVLFENREYLVESKAFIPIKLIVTDDYEVANQITKATNRQTEVKVEAFASLEPYHRKLEEFYNTFPAHERIFYSRRSNQYDHYSHDVPKGKIITLSAQTGAFVSIFLNAPQATHHYYGELLKTYAGKMFEPDHRPYMYYVSSFALNTIEHLLKVRPYKLDIFIKKNTLKHHFLMALRIVTCGYYFPSMFSKEMDKYCEGFHKKLLDNDELSKAIITVTAVLRTAMEHYRQNFRDSNAKEYHRIRVFTNEVIAEALKHQPSGSKSPSRHEYSGDRRHHN